MNRLLVVKGEGWEAALAIKEEDNTVTCRKADLEKFLKKISYTHDVISGGFTFGYEYHVCASYANGWCTAVGSECPCNGDYTDPCCYTNK